MRSISDAELFRIAMEARLAAVHVALPGIVVAYNAAAQTADVRPAVKRLVPAAEEGEFTAEEMPVVPNVPVLWPRGGSSWFAPGLDVGEGVLLVCCESDPATYIRTGEVSEPGDVRRHSLAHAVAIPGFGPRSAALPPPGPSLTTDAAALASKLDAMFRLVALGTAAVPATNPATTMALVNQILAAIQSVYLTPVTTVGSNRLKLED